MPGVSPDNTICRQNTKRPAHPSLIQELHFTIAATDTVFCTKFVTGQTWLDAAIQRPCSGRLSGRVIAERLNRRCILHNCKLRIHTRSTAICTQCRPLQGHSYRPSRSAGGRYLTVSKQRALIQGENSDIRQYGVDACSANGPVLSLCYEQCDKLALTSAP